MARRTKDSFKWFAGVACIAAGFLAVELLGLLRDGWNGLIEILEGDE